MAVKLPSSPKPTGRGNRPPARPGLDNRPKQDTRDLLGPKISQPTDPALAHDIGIAQAPITNPAVNPETETNASQPAVMAQNEPDESSVDSDVSDEQTDNDETQPETTDPTLGQRVDQLASVALQAVQRNVRWILIGRLVIFLAIVGLGAIIFMTFFSQGNSGQGGSRPVEAADVFYDSAKMKHLLALADSLKAKRDLTIQALQELLIELEKMRRQIDSDLTSGETKTKALAKIDEITTTANNLCIQVDRFLKGSKDTPGASSQCSDLNPNSQPIDAKSEENKDKPKKTNLKKFPKSITDLRDKMDKQIDELGKILLEAGGSKNKIIVQLAIEEEAKNVRNKTFNVPAYDFGNGETIPAATSGAGAPGGYRVNTGSGGGANGADAWCAGFVRYIYMKAGYKDYPTIYRADTLYYWMDQHQHAFTLKEEKPQPGDILFTSSQNRDGLWHVGIVIAVHDTYVTSIEGNTGGDGGVGVHQKRREFGTAPGSGNFTVYQFARMKN